MASEGDAAQESVVLASFENRYAAERMLASLGREFRKKARKGAAAAFVVSGNKDGSLKLVQSRVLTAGGLVAAILGVAVAMMAGLVGTLSMLRGAKAEVHAVRERESHVGADEQRGHEILGEAGPNAAIALICCQREETQTVAARAAERGRRSWHGSREQFLAGLDPDSRHDWVRAALGASR